MTLFFVFFSLFSSLALLSSILVVLSKNPIFSVLFLVLSFCNVSALFFFARFRVFANNIYGSLRRCDSCSFFVRSDDVKHQIIRAKSARCKLFTRYSFAEFRFYIRNFYHGALRVFAC
jgi:hypothetical protein